VFRRAPAMVDHFARLFGPFPYEKLANVQSATRFGGMENASAIFYSQEALAQRRDIEGTVSHDVVDATFTGHVEALDGREPRVLLQLENPDFDASRLTALLSARTRAERQPYLEGSLAFSLRVSGPLGAEGPRAVGSVTVRDGGFRLNGESLAEDVSGTVSVAADSLTTRSVRGVLASGPFDLVAGIDRVSGHGLATVRARPDLAVLQRVGLLGRAPSLSGDAVVSLALDGSLDSLDALRPTGTIGLRGVRAEPAGLEPDRPEGKIDAEDEKNRAIEQREGQAR